METNCKTAEMVWVKLIVAWTRGTVWMQKSRWVKNVFGAGGVQDHSHVPCLGNCINGSYMYSIRSLEEDWICMGTRIGFAWERHISQTAKDQNVK